MQKSRKRVVSATGMVILAAVGLGLTVLGCGGGAALFNQFGTLFTAGGSSSGGGTGAVGGTSGIGGGGTSGGNDRSAVNPCELNQAQKFVRISMRNQNPDDHIHYFVIFIAYLYQDGVADADGLQGQWGAACSEDRELYRSNGYDIEVFEGDQLAIGNYCIEGPALVQFYENGSFQRTSGSGQEFASAIAPATGSVPTYDIDFNQTGLRLPVPNVILWHNPGTGEGLALKVSTNARNACSDPDDIISDPQCRQDAFYYVDERDLASGSQVLGTGSYRRVPSEIQGTQCRSGFANAFQTLAPAGVGADFARDYEFLRGGSITYAFIRQDEEPPFPQLLWRVTDSRGAVAHTFDSRAGISN